MLMLRLRPSTSIRSLARRATAAAALVGVAVLGSACSGSPAAPGSLSAERRVETGSGGGTLCPPTICTGFDGRIEIIAGGGSLSGPTVGSQVGTEASRFQLTSQMTGTGRFDHGFISFSVERETATINAIWYSSEDRVYEDTGVTAPATVALIDDKACASGMLVETTITAMFENFGKTTITEKHCAQ
jgi:hypothetical protein